MDRRELLKMVAVFAPLAPKIVFQGDEFDLAQLKTYKGYSIRWRGFFHRAESDICVGQWIAYGTNPKRPHVYSSYPGATDTFWPTQFFDVGLREGQELPTFQSTEEQLRGYQAEALARLLHYLDNDPDGKLHHG